MPAAPEGVNACQIGELSPRPVSIFNVALDPNDASTLFATGLEGTGTVNLYRVFRSRDSGRTWQRITSDSDGALRENPVVDAIGDLYATDSGVVLHYSEARGTWESWQAPIGVPMLFLANPQRPGWLYAVSTNMAVYSTDGGRNWLPMIGVTGFTAISLAPNGNDVYASNQDGMFASGDSGITWSRLGSDQLPTNLLAVAPSLPSTIYRLAFGGVDRPAVLLRSDDGGATWITLHWPGEGGQGITPQALTVDPRDERTLWIGMTHTADGGATWTTEPSNIPGGVLHVFIDRNGAMLYATPSSLSGVWAATLRGNHRRAAGR